MPEVYKVSYYDAGDDLRQALTLYLKVEEAESLKSDRAKVLQFLSARDSKDYRPNTFHKDLEFQKQESPVEWKLYCHSYWTKEAFEVNHFGVIRTMVQVPKENV